MVDSLFFQDGGIPTNHWREYKFVAKGGLSDRFWQNLERACVTDSTHWTYTEGCVSDFYYEGTGEPMIGDQMVYHYEIYPDQEPVDRSRGMCDRMVEGSDGKMIPDWDGSYITVDIVNDTIIFRSRHSFQQRLYVVDLNTGDIVMRSLCGHGRGGDSNIFKGEFSNVPESLTYYV